MGSSVDGLARAPVGGGLGEGQAGPVPGAPHRCRAAAPRPRRRGRGRGGGRGGPGQSRRPQGPAPGDVIAMVGSKPVEIARTTSSRRSPGCATPTGPRCSSRSYAGRSPASWPSGSPEGSSVSSWLPCRCRTWPRRSCGPPGPPSCRPPGRPGRIRYTRLARTSSRSRGHARPARSKTIPRPAPSWPGVSPRADTSWRRPARARKACSWPSRASTT